MKKITLLLLAVTVLVMMAATIVEKFQGTPFVAAHIYGSWWFVLLWTLLSIAGCIYIIRQKLYKRFAVMMLHVSFIVVLIGALTTYLTAQRGDIHLRKGSKVTMFTDENQITHQLPFTLQVESFNVTYYTGTDAPLDYISDVIASDKEGSETLHISMNNIGTFRGYRLFQSAYDSDMQGTILGMAYDPYGITITYIGYLLMLLSIICVIFSKHTRIRQLYRLASHKAVLVIVIVNILAPVSANAENHHTISCERADKFGELLVLYNGRVCPINTLAIDFVTKLSGSPSWDGLSANEIFTGWVFYSSAWESEKIIRIKDKEAQHILGIDGQWASFNDFWDHGSQYKLEEPLKKAYQSGDEATQKHLRDADEKFNLINMFYNGEFLRIYPYPIKTSQTANAKTSSAGNLKWSFPGDTYLPKQMPTDEWYFVRKSMDYLTESIMINDEKTTDLLLDKLGKYQRKRGGEFLPTPEVVKAELTYNTMQTQRWPVYLALVMGIVIFVCCFIRQRRWIPVLCNVWNVILLVWLTMLLGLRWYISDHLPMSNGFETMQFMAWAMILLTIILQWPFRIIRAFGPLLAGLSLLVALISGQNPQITQLMPVLQSPLLSIHVVIIMFSYALLAMTFLVSLTAIIINDNENGNHNEKSISKNLSSGESEGGLESNVGFGSLTALSQLLLYPAVMCLTIGIFIGAVWANVSWGRYWSWDSKETWALITMLIYALPLHSTLFPHHRVITIRGRHISVYNIYMVLAFLTVLMTYFGVNYFLAGMHSYANL